MVRFHPQWQRARALLRSCVNERDWAMYRDLGFLRVWGGLSVHAGGQEAPYARIEVLVNKDHMVPAQLKYFNADGTNVKTETRTGYTCEGDVCTPGELKMTDNVKGNWTKLIAKSRKVNVEISDDAFTQRNLGE